MTDNIPRIEASAGARLGLIRTKEGGRFCSHPLGIQAEAKQFRQSHLSRRCTPTARIDRNLTLVEGRNLLVQTPRWGGYVYDRTESPENKSCQNEHSLYESPCRNYGPMRVMKFIDPATTVGIFRHHSIAIYACTISNGVHVK